MTSKKAYDLKQERRLAVFMARTAVLVLGIVMLVAPGLGILTIMLELGILTMEFLWARRLLKRFREKGTNLANRLLKKGASCSSPT